MFIDLGDSSAEEGPDEKFPPLDFGLDYDEREVCFWVHVASHAFIHQNLRHQSDDLLLYTVCAAFDQAVAGPAGSC